MSSTRRALLRTAGPLLLTLPALGMESCCFGGSTWISLRRGRKRLKDVQVGDVVQSFDLVTGKLAERPVVRVFEHRPTHVGRLLSKAGRGPRRVTPNHPIFLEFSGEFLAAGLMDDQHRRRRGLYWDDADLRSIELEPYRSTASGHLLPVYNLSIEGTKTYFADGLLVHNKSEADCYGRLDDCYYQPEGGAGGLGGAGSGGLLLGDGGTTTSGGASSGGIAGSSGAAGSAGEDGAAGSAGGEP